MFADGFFAVGLFDQSLFGETEIIIIDMLAASGGGGGRPDNIAQHFQQDDDDLMDFLAVFTLFRSLR